MSGFGQRTSAESAEGARAIFDVLVEECDAHPDSFPEFAAFMARDDKPGEFRFNGSLGFGGKVWCNGGGRAAPRVSCYREDETDERLRKIARANERLADLGRSLPESANRKDVGR